MAEATIPIERYQAGGDIYATLAAQYGTNAANSIAAAAATGDREQLTEAIAYVRNGAALDDSTASIFIDQLLTDPLAAPLDALDKGINQIFNSEGVKTILTVVAVGAVIALVIYASKD